MVYANDQWIQLPVRDLYDSQMMLASIQAAREMYNQARDDMNKFYDKYGDFMSPIASDIEKYNNTIINPIREGIQDLYNRGIDPLRSQQGRMMLANIRNNIDTSKASLWKQRAENARAWYKNMAELRSKGLYNKDFSEFLKETPDQWDENSMGFTSPTAYDDLNAHTSHWFDKINREGYLYTDKEGYDWVGVNRDDLIAAMDSQIPDFLNSDYGKYQAELAKRQLGPNATKQDIIDRVKSNIAYSQSEMLLSPTRKLNPLKQLEINDMYEAKQAARKHYYEVKKMKLEHPEWFDKNGKRIVNPTPNSEDEEYDSAQGLSFRGLIHSGGADDIEDPDEAIAYARDHIIDRQMSALRYTNGRMSNRSAVDYMINAASIEESPQNFARYIGRDVVDKETGAVRFVQGDDGAGGSENKIYSKEYLVSNQYGMNNTEIRNGVRKVAKVSTGSDGFDGNTAYVPTNRVQTFFFKDTDNKYKVGQFWEVVTGTIDEEGHVDTSDSEVRYIKLPTTKAATNNMPSYGHYKKYKEKKGGAADNRFRPNINTDRRTRGLKNTGSQQVNVSEHTPQKTGFAGTYNEEAMRR